LWNQKQSIVQWRQNAGVLVVLAFCLYHCFQKHLVEFYNKITMTFSLGIKAHKDDRQEDYKPQGA
jgi:hypothetical protein